MSDSKTKEFCGLTWSLAGGPFFDQSSWLDLYQLEDVACGTLYIADDVIKYCNDHKEVQYKILSLLYEQHILGVEKNFSIVLREEQRIKWSRPQDCCFTIDELLGLFPENIMEILERALLKLSRQYPERGQKIAITGINQERHPLPYYCFFAKDRDEQEFIIDAMLEKNWLSKINGTYTWPLKITVTGWLEIEGQIKKENSKKIFVAMWFDDSMQEARKQIKSAIRDVGYTPSLIDEKPHNNEISGEILREINNSAFVIADVTEQRQGVYFEAGYAMGQKKQVVFCCRKDQLNKIHFDTRQYNHIVWETELDLFNKLRDRLLGTIALK